MAEEHSQFVGNQKPHPTDYDGAWKEALEHYFRPFLEFCFPQIAAALDWSVPIEFLDKELQEVVRDAELGKQRADKLVKLRRLDGQEEWVLVHVEVQGRPDPDLPRRMYLYYHRIQDRYGRPVVSLAVLADTDPQWRPTVHQEGLWGCELRFTYCICKLLDFARKPELEESDNPIALVIAAHLAAQATVGDMGARHQFKWQLVRRLHERGYGKKDILDLFRLLDWLLVLPKELEIVFRRELVDYENEKHMPHVTSIERLAREEGIEEGRRATLRENILAILQTRFGTVPSEMRELITAVQDDAKLKQLLLGAALCVSLADFKSSLESDTSPR